MSEETKKVWIIVIVVLVVLAQVYGVYRLILFVTQKKSGKVQDGWNKVIKDDSPSPEPKPSPQIKWYIQKGSPRKTEIRFLQTYLNWKKNAGLKVDGDWGRLTQAAVINAGLPSQLSNLDIKVLLDEYNNRSVFDNLFGLDSYSNPMMVLR